MQLSIMMAERPSYGLSGAIPGRSGLGAVVVERMVPGLAGGVSGRGPDRAPFW